ncbi:MAG: hypothetical protein ACYC6X_02200 [Minisyncoccota bacterium]
MVFETDFAKRRQQWWEKEIQITMTWNELIIAVLCLTVFPIFVFLLLQQFHG